MPATPGAGRRALDEHPNLPRLAAPVVRSRDVSSLEAELEKRARVAAS